jgi:WD40 repeat protein/DNA-binding SARP family transcriptional activator
MAMSRLEFRILGPLAIRVDGVSVRIGGRKQRALLAMLLLSANRVVSRERLIAELFAERTYDLADHAVRNHVSRLRKLLRGITTDEPRLVARPPGYLLRVEPGELDLETFEQLVTEGRKSLAAGDAAAAAEALRLAEALWKGPALADVELELATAEVERLEEIWLAAIEERIEAELALGKQLALVSELEQLAAANPFRERFRAQLMLALYRSGRQAEGLDVYRRTRALLHDELGLEPSAELQQLERAILVQDVSLNAVGDGARTRKPALRHSCPFKGLAPFETVDAELFFGRERLIDELAARLADAPVIAIVGPSGSGKSSLLRAGLLPAIEYDSVLIRPGMRPGAELDGALARFGPNERGVLAVDQFEELFAAGVSEHERRSFISSIVDAAWDADRRLLVVLALRADFFPRLAAHAEFGDLVAPNHVLLGPMSKSEFRRAIEGPAELAGLEVEPALVDTLVDEVAGEAGGLALLSTTLVDLWRERDGRSLTLAAYERTGGVRGAVGRYAEAAYQSLGDEERQIARWILVRLVEGGEGEPLTRRRVTRGELDADENEQIAEVVSALVEKRLLVADNGTVELVHEALIERWSRLADWLAENTEVRRQHRQLTVAASEWQSADRDPSVLYRGARLAGALDWAGENSPDLNQLEQTFLDESHAAAVEETARERRANRRLRALLVLAAVLVLVALAAAALALQKQGQARREATVATAQRLGAQALTDPSLDQSLLLAREGVALDNSQATRSNLLATLLRSPAAIGVAHEGSNRLLDEAITPNGRTLAVRGDNGTVAFFDTRTLQRVGSELPGQNQVSIFSLVPAPLHGLAYSPDGKTLVVGSTAGAGWRSTIALVKSRSQVLITSKTWASIIADVAFAPNGRTFATGELLTTNTGSPKGEVIVVRDSRTGLPRAQSPTIPTARLIGYTRDGRYLLVVAGTRRSLLLDARTMKPARMLDLGGSAAAVSPTANQAAFGRGDGTVTIVDLRSGKTRTLSGRASARIDTISFSRDGRTLATGAQDGTVSIWTVRPEALRETLRGHSAAAQAAVFSPNGRTLYTASYDGSVIAWDLAGARRLATPFRFSPLTSNAPSGAAVSPNGSLLAFSPAPDRITLWRATTRETTGAPLVGAVGHVNDIAFSPDGKLIAAAGSRHAVVWNVAARKPIRTLPAGGFGASSVAFSPNGAALAIGRLDSTLTVYNLKTGKQTASLPGDWGVTSIDFSPNGKLLASATLSGSTTVWNLAQQNAASALTGPVLAHAVRYSPDGRLIAVGDSSGTVTLWKLEPNHRASIPGQTIWAAQSVSQLTGHGGAVRSIDFDPHGKTLITLSDDGQLRLWDVATRKLIGAPLPGSNTSGSVHFFPDGQHILATFQTGTAIIWNVDPRAWNAQACDIAHRNLTHTEWTQFLGRRTYHTVCP